jgi:uncharacterized protein (DUF1501 family)
MIGGRVEGGMYGAQPSLDDLQNNDLRFKVDYRSLYNTVAEKWLGVSTSLDQSKYPALDIIT